MTNNSALIRELLSVLQDERQTVLDVLATSPTTLWTAPTPAEGWDVRDQIIHLAHFDFMAGLALSDPQSFLASIKKIKDLGAYVDLIGPANASRSNENILQWWKDQADFLARSAVTCVEGATEESPRAPWFGVSMSPASMITARIMETWAHSQDVLDTGGVKRAPSVALDHIAYLGVRALPHSFVTHGEEVPTVPVRVELIGFDGKSLEFGPEDAEDVVSGSVEDFALVVTQRRHVADTGISTRGPVAEKWMRIAQAFAGAPGAGRAAGQFV